MSFKYYKKHVRRFIIFLKRKKIVTSQCDIPSHCNAQLLVLSNEIKTVDIKIITQLKLGLSCNYLLFKDGKL